MLHCHCSANSTRLRVQDSSSPSLIAGKRFPRKAIQFTLSSYSPPTISFSTKSSINLMDSVPKSQEPRFEFLTKKPYLPPSWASHLNLIPSHVFSLGHFPTPIHRWKLPNLPKNTEVYIKALVPGPFAFSRYSEFAEVPMAKCGYDFVRYGGFKLNGRTIFSSGVKNLKIGNGWWLHEQTGQNLKRDDLSGMQLSGNKVRKLEFLLADAVAQGADCIITIGGIQSNHCRATAVAAKYLNLDCYLILRTSKVLVDKDPGLTGNLLVERLVGAHIDLVSKEEYAKVGSVALTSVLKEKLLNEGRKPYVIPVGGSNSLGTWGYIEAIKEIKKQCGKGNGETIFDDIVVACGSGGTIAGLSVGCLLSDLGAKVHAYCVCDDPDYFYDYSQGLLDGLQAGVSSRDIVRIQNAKGLGYAMSSSEELKFVSDIAAATGVVLDPVYSGKAAYGMMKEMVEEPEKWEGRKILFIHTGGLLGLFDKADEMARVVGKWRRMDIHASVPQKEGIGKMF